MRWVQINDHSYRAVAGVLVARVEKVPGNDDQPWLWWIFTTGPLSENLYEGESSCFDAAEHSVRAYVNNIIREIVEAL